MRNQVQLIGNVGINPEITNYENGKKKVRFTLATHEKFKDKEGKQHRKTFWHHVYAWGPTANYLAKAAKKGSALAITGKLVTNKYQSKNGTPRSFTSVEAKNAIALK